ncbi:MAG: oxygen-independent coproporphyrinogen III oxidase [Verrucomicrobia bacterium]|nr:oxygen-independent coproporphyrinogen III oxidase [Verrucomicrobiota bacterium]
MPDMIVPCVDLDLLCKYDTAGPRYTSYPTAPQFTSSFTAADFREEIRAANAVKEAPPLSLYFHLPFCESVCFFCGCNVTFTSDRKRPRPYTDLLIREMDSVAPMVAPHRRVAQLHWGGGTPTFFPPAELKRLHDATRERFSFAADAEVGLEVDPRETTSEHLRTLQELGFNRLSMGIQDFDPAVQKAVNRIQTEEITRRVIEEARERGFQSVSVDLIYGLPLQTERSFAATLERIVALNPDRVAVFNLAYLPEVMRHQKAIKADTLPPPRTKLALLRLAIERFTAAGYRYIGMDHFAKPDDELCRAQDDGALYRNFQGYTTHAGCDLHAFGASAISQVRRVYAQNCKNVREYEAMIQSQGLASHRGIRLSDDDVLRREIIMRLMCDFALDPDAIGRRFGIEFSSYFAEALEMLIPMETDGLIRRDNEKIVVTPVGRLLIRNICMPFDAWLKKKPGQKFSRTV